METINLPFIEPTAVGATTSVQFGNWVLHNNVYYTNGWIPGDNGEISFYLQESDLEQNINFKYIPTTISKSCKEQAHSPTSDASGEPENYKIDLTQTDSSVSEVFSKSAPISIETSSYTYYGNVTPTSVTIDFLCKNDRIHGKTTIPMTISSMGGSANDQAIISFEPALDEIEYLWIVGASNTSGTIYFHFRKETRNLENQNLKGLFPLGTNLNLGSTGQDCGIVTWQLPSQPYEWSGLNNNDPIHFSRGSGVYQLNVLPESTSSSLTINNQSYDSNMENIRTQIEYQMLEPSSENDSTEKEVAYYYNVSGPTLTFTDSISPPPKGYAINVTLDSGNGVCPTS